MNKLRKSVAILGEGITEYYYFQSLRDLFPRITVKPDYPKHSSISELERKIAEYNQLGYDYIFCVIDMDNKKAQEKQRYDRLKAKYTNPNRKKQSTVEFFETHLCTELFFLYYFKYTAKEYDNQDNLIADLSKYVKGYEKTEKFFVKCKGLHKFLEKNGGELIDRAIENAKRSVDEKDRLQREYTFSDLGSLIERLKEFN